MKFFLCIIISPGNFPANGMPFLKKSKHAPIAAMTMPTINKNFPKSAIKDLIPYTSTINIVEIRRVNQWTIGNIAPVVNQRV